MIEPESPIILSVVLIIVALLICCIYFLITYDIRPGVNAEHDKILKKYNITFDSAGKTIVGNSKKNNRGGVNK